MGFKGCWVRVVRGLFAASLGARGATAAFAHNARGVSAAFPSNARGAAAVFCSNARGAHFQTPAVLPVRSRSFVSSSVREQVGSLLCRSGRSEVRRCNARVPCAPSEPLTLCALPAANSPAFSVDSCTALTFGSLRAMGGFTQWAGRQKGGGDGSRREPTPKGGGRHTEVLAEVGSDRRLHLVRDLRAEAVEATAAAMEASAAAAGSADAPASAAPAEGAKAEDADTEPSSSDSELPDTTAPAVAKAEERSGAAQRSAADVDMATDMTEAAAADPSLTVGELVDKTTKKLEHMSAYMEGAARMVGFEGALSSRAGAEHRRVLEHAEELLQKSEEYLKERAAEARAAASGAPSSRECGAWQ